MSRSNPMHHGSGPDPLIDDDDSAHPGVLPDCCRDSAEFLPASPQHSAAPKPAETDSDAFDF